MTKSSHQEQQQQPPEQKEKAAYGAYTIRFREQQPVFSATSRITNLKRGEIVMAQTDKGLEPATVTGPGILPSPPPGEQPKASYILIRRANREEQQKFASLIQREQEAFALCQEKIIKHKLVMKLINVERFFNGSKIIFYFTAENRVDFRALVKDLVQEFRTRVEMRQIGVRHETKMVGGLGCCGRELCCSSYLKNFDPVSIKMAKAQDLPLNPAKISGICNRLLCCLTYEYKTYHALKKDMPRQGKMITLNGKRLKVMQVNTLKQSLSVIDPETPDSWQTLSYEEWRHATFERPQKRKPKQKKNKK